MLKGALVGLLVLATIGPQFKGCDDLKKSVTRLEYYQKRDMRSTVAIVPQKTLLLTPDSLSVPVGGRPDMLTQAALLQDRVGATAKLVNPTAADQASIARGERSFATFCVPCHGKSMVGDGTVAAAFMPPPDLLGQVTRGRSDGYIYSYIRYGGVVMPRYGQMVTAAETWDLVNYVRSMQKSSPR